MDSAACLQMAAFPRFFFRYLTRTLWLLGCTLGFLLVFLVLLVLRSHRRARVLSSYLQLCGAGFVKLGQLLAMRYDLIPELYQLELAKLLDAMPAIPFARIRRHIEADLRRPLHECFARVEEQPMGAASIAQAHAAWLHSGESVVIKVMRPGVKEQFEVDFLNLSLLTRFIDFLGILSPIDMTGLARESARLVRQELDFRREARNAHLIAGLMASDDIAHRAPKVYFEFSGDHVLTLERLTGVWVKDILQALRSNDQEQLARWREQGVNPTRVARLLFRSIMEQCYRHRVFHADPHAGNLIVTPDGMLGFIDFGTVGVLDERLWAQQFRIFETLSSGGVHAAYEALLASLEPLDTQNLTEFESEVKTLLGDWMVTAQNPYSSGAEKSAARLLLQLGDAMRRARLHLPWNVLRLYRVQIVSDMVVYTLHPQLNPIEELNQFFIDERRRQQRLFLSGSPNEDTAARFFNSVIAARNAASEVVYWLRYTLPRLGRQYTNQATRLELALGLVTHYVRVSAVLIAIGAATAQWGLWQPATPELQRLLTGWGWVITGASAGLALILGRIRQRLTDPT